uniref:Uncharacterized protein n=1 Tax=Sphaerodactylus townsendi TaxID=933632 RepID=A0ACB8FIP6_9SAUR
MTVSMQCTSNSKRDLSEAPSLPVEFKWANCCMHRSTNVEPPACSPAICPATMSPPRRGVYWQVEEATILLRTVRDRGYAWLLMSSTGLPNQRAFRAVTRALQEAGYHRTEVQACTKWKALKRDFYSAMEACGGHPRCSAWPLHFTALRQLWLLAGQPRCADRWPESAAARRRALAPGNSWKVLLRDERPSPHPSTALLRRARKELRRRGHSAAPPHPLMMVRKDSWRPLLSPPKQLGHSEWQHRPVHRTASCLTVIASDCIKICPSSLGFAPTALAATPPTAMDPCGCSTLVQQLAAHICKNDDPSDSASTLGQPPLSGCSQAQPCSPSPLRSHTQMGRELTGASRGWPASWSFARIRVLGGSDVYGTQWWDDQLLFPPLVTEEPPQTTTPPLCPASVQWRRGKLLLPGRDSAHLKIHDAGNKLILEIAPTFDNDFGRYNCTATNRIGTRYQEYILDLAAKDVNQRHRFHNNAKLLRGDDYVSFRLASFALIVLQFLKVDYAG